MLILKYTIQYYYISLTSTKNNIVRERGNSFFSIVEAEGLSWINKSIKIGKSDLINIYCIDQNWQKSHCRFYFIWIPISNDTLNILDSAAWHNGFN